MDSVPPELRKRGMEFEAENAKGEVTVQDIRHATPGEIKNSQPSGGNLPPLQ